MSLNCKYPVKQITVKQQERKQITAKTTERLSQKIKTSNNRNEDTQERFSDDKIKKK